MYLLMPLIVTVNVIAECFRTGFNILKNKKMLQSVRITLKHLKTKRRLLYLKTQSVPRCKHLLSRL
jgi:hypothetical protein